MVTGRELPDLRSVFPALDLFDAVVSENGALLYRPGQGEQLLAPPAPAALVADLRRRGVEPLAVGRAIVATLSANAGAVAEAIAASAPSWQMIFNKDSVMVLPEGVDKASGLLAALHALGLASPEVLGVGDA
jgi:hydroxymethylpyrimidine pyrophosphatase-like HAD family hydrolase